MTSMTYKGIVRGKVRPRLDETFHKQGDRARVWVSDGGDCRVFGGSLCYSESEVRGFERRKTRNV